MTIYLHGKTSTAMRKRIEIPRMARDFGVLVDAHLGILLLLGMIIMTLSIIPMVIFAFSKKSSKKRDHNNRGARTMKAMTEKVVVRVDTKTKEAKMSQQHHVPKSNVPPTILPIYVPPPVLPNHNHKHHHHRDNSHHHHHHHHTSSHNHHHHIASIHHHVPMHVHHSTVVL